MRRKDREVKEFDEIVKILDACDTIRLGINGGDYPYVVALSFGYEIRDEKISIYFHGAKDGEKHERLEKDNRVCVEASRFLGYKLSGHDATTEFESVVGFGKAYLTEGEEMKKGLKLVLDHCTFTDFEYNPAILKVMKIYRIDLETVTGKRRIVKQ